MAKLEGADTEEEIKKRLRGSATSRERRQRPPEAAFDFLMARSARSRRSWAAHGVLVAAVGMLFIFQGDLQQKKLEAVKRRSTRACSRSAS